MAQEAVRLGAALIATTFLAVFGGIQGQASAQAVKKGSPNPGTSGSVPGPPSVPTRSQSAPSVDPADKSTPAAASNTLVIIADGEPNSQAKTVARRIRHAVTLVLRKHGALGPQEEFPPKQACLAEQLDGSRPTRNARSGFITWPGPSPGEDREHRSIPAMLPDLNEQLAAQLNLGGPYALKNLRGQV